MCETNCFVGDGLASITRKTRHITKAGRSTHIARLSSISDGFYK